MSGNCTFKRDCAIILSKFSQHLAFESCIFVIVFKDILRPLNLYIWYEDTMPSQVMAHSSWVGEEHVLEMSLTTSFFAKT